MVRELVLPPDFDDFVAFEVESKGYLDAAVRVDDALINVTFYDPTRLQQDIVDDLEAFRHFTAKRLLVIELVTIENMKWAVTEAPSEFFE